MRASKILPLLLLRRRREVLFCPRGPRARARVRAVFLKLFSSLFPKSSFKIQSKSLKKKGRNARESHSTLSVAIRAGAFVRKNSAAARVQNKETRFISSFSSLSVSLSVSLMVTRAGCEKQQIYIIIL